MKSFLIIFLLIQSVSFTVASQTVDDKLSVFSQFLGNWQAEFKSPPGKPKVVDVSKWERALNGKAIRTLHSINNGEYGGESLIFFDKKSQEIVFYYFTTADFYTQGTIEVVDSKNFIAYEDVVGSSDGITKVKSLTYLSGKNMTVETSYLQNGEWTESEKRTYYPSESQVVFK